MEVYMVIVDTPHGAVAFDWRGLSLFYGKKILLSPTPCLIYCHNTLNVSCAFSGRGYHKMDKEKLYRRLYDSFVEKPESGKAEPHGENNTQEERNGGTNRG
jgi:hypothetical protein